MKKTKAMGAQAQSESQKFTPLTNAERCLICYGRHTESESEVGIGFELRNLKEIFIKSFGIPFLPHFSKYGLVYMCARCHEEFLKVESLYDDLKCNESKFDAAREKLAFLIVDSIMTSGYISNYIHGNAFDSIRYLVFKGWCTKFRKQGLVKKNNNNSINKVTNENDSSKQIFEKIAGNEQGFTLEESDRSMADTSDSSVDGSSPVNKNPPKETAVNTSPPKLESATSQQPVVSDETNAPVLSKKHSANPEVQDVKTPSVLSELPDQESQLTGTEGEQGVEVSSSSEPVRNGTAKAAESKLEISVKTDDKKSAVTSTSIDAKTAEPDAKQNKNADKSNTKTDSVTSNSKNTIGITKTKVEQPSAKNTLTSGTKQPPDNPPPRRVNLGSNASQSTYITTSDGRKLLPQSLNTKVIFVRKDPVTGKMIQVPRPNQSSVKGKLNGKDVIIRTAPSSTAAGLKPASTSVVLPDGTAVSVSLPKGTAASSSTVTTPVVTKVATAAPAVSSTLVSRVATAASAVSSSPLVPKIVSVQSIKKEVTKPATPPPPQLEAQAVIQEPVQGITEASSKTDLRSTHSPVSEKNAQGAKSPRVLSKVVDDSPEPRSSRSGRRIKRPFESSAWASGHEMDKLVSQSLKNGRHQFHSSPNKRQKADAKAPNIPVEATDVEEPVEAQNNEEASHD